MSIHRVGRAQRDPAMPDVAQRLGLAQARPNRSIGLLAALCVLAPPALGQDASRGKAKYEECIACHALDPKAEAVGPSLHGLFQRKAGEGADFRYSPAMKRSGIAWTPPTLDAFLADPQAVVPANRMPYAGMPSAADRADLIAYLLQTFK